MGLRHHMGRLLKGLARNDRRHKLPRRHKFRPLLEGLEQRHLLTGVWTQIQTTNPLSGPRDGTQALMQLSNGVVMFGQNTAPNPGANFGIASQQTTWFQLSPTSSGQFINGTWGAQSTMNTPRLYFPTVMMPDGRIFAIGGEYSPTVGFVNAPEIYDPLTNKWTSVAPMPSPPTSAAIFPSVPPTTPQSQFGDDPIVVLPNGDILAGWFNGPQTFIYNPATNTWRQPAGGKLRSDPSDEETWIKLADGSILSYDIFASETAGPLGTGQFHAQRFVPSLDMWVDASNLDPNNPPGILTSTLQFGAELGPGFLLPDGRVFLFGANGTSAYYNPATDLWSAGPNLPFDTSLTNFPQQLGATDNPGAVMPNGKVLIALSVNQPLFSPPTHIFEFDPATNVFTDVTPPPFSTLNFNNFNFNDASAFRMLVLPTGQILVTSLDTSNTGSIFSGPDLVYTPDGAPRDSWRPTIQSIKDNGNGTFTLTGTQLNGVSEGAAFGDDAEMATNYPLLRMTDKSGNIVYARTFNWSSTGVQTGNQVVSTKFTLPPGTRLTDFTNYTVVASGIPSLPFQFFPIAPQNVSGIKFNDLNANGIRDAGEPGLAGVVIYADLNNDGKVSIVEPATVTDAFGRWTIKGMKPGNYVIREAPSPGGTQTMPGVLGVDLAGVTPIANAYTISVLDRPITGLAFGNTVARDFGDAPDSYGTTLARDGARHGVLAGFHLGLLEDAEADGQPTADATGDDTLPIPPTPLPTPPPPSPDDEDGITFINGVTPGATSTIQVIVSTGGNSPGKLQGWIDFNANGKFDANEKIISNLMLGAGPHLVSFAVPATAKVTDTFARFRYGYETDLGPTGSSVAGEVEDYEVAVLPSVPIANPDEFGLPPNIIKQGTRNNPLDVLANDTRTALGAPQIVESDFPKTLPSGSTVTVGPFNPVLGRKVLLYTPTNSIAAPFDDTFTYRVTDGFSISAPGTVLVHVSLANPIALDDTFTFDPTSQLVVDPNNPANLTTIQPLAVMANDVFPVADTHIKEVHSITVNAQTTMAIDATDPTKLDFDAPAGFRGTEIFEYTITDSDPDTNDSSAFVTVQIVNGGINATVSDLTLANYLAELDVNLISPATGQPTSSLIVDQGDTFQVLITSRDLRPGGDTTNRGVQAAYLDLLFDRKFVDPVSITYDPVYSDQHLGAFNQPATGEIGEAGAFAPAQVSGVGPGVISVFTVTLRAKQSTAGQPIHIFGDPADGLPSSQHIPTDSQKTDVVIMPNDPATNVNPTVALHEIDQAPSAPQVLQTFLRPSGELTILGGGEGEFVNRANPLDVNEDGHVAPSDALLVINTLNARGSGALQGSIAASVPKSAMVDVNMDSHISPIDALLVINYLNKFMSAARPAAGEGEADTATDASPADDSVTDLALLSSSPSGGTSGPSSASTSAVLLTTTAPTTSTTSASTTGAASTVAGSSSQPSSTKVDATAADDLYAGLDAARQQLRQRFNRHH